MSKRGSKPASLSKWLTALGIPRECIEEKSSAEERGRRFVIRPDNKDEIWRVKVDACWLSSVDGKKVDFVFWGQSASGKQLVLLVELKGKNFGKALKQVDATLQRLCKTADGKEFHRGANTELKHIPPINGGVRAYVVLSSGRAVPQQFHERERIRNRYKVIVHAKSTLLEIRGLDSVYSLI